ncbi:TIGR03032 family protein [Rhizobium sp. FKL33]|uniref:TIGR03032 family protein n=1 Tax=Rhizobium sp. FKL33 TaxID=2562307 RepID=UPI0010BFD3F9|nr:TIGR03032 family protein [Rhizobium sp. FKL33]
MKSTPAPSVKLELFASRQFVSWLKEAGCSIALSTYQSGKVLFIGANSETDRISVFERSLDRPMGMAVSGNRLAIASLYQIYTFIDALGEGESTKGADAVYVPQMSHFTGDLDVHDMGYTADGKLVFANTLFSCISEVSETHSFKPLWKPSFISRLAAEDRCHLNGLAMRDGRPAYATAVGKGDMADSWRDARVEGGVVLDVESGDIVCQGLSMPHSPRWHDGRLYVLNSGQGEFGRIDLVSGKFEPIAFLPGYARGLTFLDHHAVIGLSAPRENRTFHGLPLQDRLDAQGMKPRCGVQVVDLGTGDVAHWLTIEGIVTELYDVIALAGRRSPSMIGFKSDEIRRVISMDGPGRSL